MVHVSFPGNHWMTPGALLFVFALSGCSNQVVAPAASVAATVDLIPTRIDATGKEDVSSKLQAWLDSLPDNSRIIAPAGARYRVEFGVMVEGRRGFHFDAQDSQNPPTLFQTQLEPYGVGDRENRNRQVLAFRLGGGHSLRNWILQGAHKNSGYDGVYIADLEAQHGLLIAGVEGMLVEDVFITEVAGDFIYLNNRFANGVNTLNRDITIRRVKGRKNGRQGVAVTGGINMLIEHNDFQDIQRSAFDIEPNSVQGSIQHLVVRKNVFGGFRNNWVAGHGSSDADVHHITFEDNEVIGRPLVFHLLGWRTTSTKPVGKRRSHIRVVNNRAHSIVAVTNSNMTVMGFSGLDSVEVIGNVVEFTGQKPIVVGAHFNETCGIVYRGNTWGNARYDRKVTVAYQGDGTPLFELNGKNLEWPKCSTSAR